MGVCLLDVGLKEHLCVDRASLSRRTLKGGEVRLLTKKGEKEDGEKKWYEEQFPDVRAKERTQTERA